MGASAGSFLNVVVYRLPLELSIVRPASHCMGCKHPIAWYDNIPIISWFVLMGRCRHCRATFSFRYPFVELLTAMLFVGLYWAYFMEGVRSEMPLFGQGGYVVYSGHIIMLCALLACSLIDAEHWVIPLSVSYIAAGVGLIMSTIAPYWAAIRLESPWGLTPYASPGSGAAALGAVVGLAVSLLLLKFGLLKRSFAEWEQDQIDSQKKANSSGQSTAAGNSGDTATKNTVGTSVGINTNVRREMMREIAFLAPIVAGGLIFLLVLGGEGGPGQWWQGIILEQKWMTGWLGGVFGFMIGGGVVWATRILGSLAFGKEAMGLGDVHLMAAVGAVLGWAGATIAFFVAPFFGLGWALTRLALHRSREIPYGPFLSMGTLLVMVLYDMIIGYFAGAFTIPGAMP